MSRAAIVAAVCAPVWIPIDRLKPAVRRTGAHAMAGKISKWPYCTRCGLIALRNAATTAALRAPCEWQE